ncbi:sulfotransferase, partial [Microcoleus sp.]|uniref:sulfotransferase family protein n=1 Tax=Microcoleus sp. TaxID=44472 RepID=UPI00352376FF
MKPTESQDSSLKGSNLIFLISQPRAGSTLTQRILGGHPDIHTVSEPWLMLPPLTAWHSTIGYNTDYDQALAQVAVSSFIGSLSQGEEDYVQGLRRMYSYLYEKAREASGKRYFLDKTPRYFYIINELYRTFPEARFIFLFRNPLSVLCSIVTTWAKDDLHTLKKFKNDLFMAPQKLLEGVTNLGKQCLVIHYEWLLMRSDEEIARVCDFLGISFRPEVAEYGVSNTSPAWMYGDQVKLYQNTKPDSSNLNKWLEEIKQPQIWRLASDYLQILGEETIDKLGYSYHELWSTLNQEVPTIEQLKDTLPLDFYCEETLSSRSEVSHFIQLTQKSLGGWIGAKKKAGDALYGLPKQQEAQYQESLTRVHKESQKLQTDLEQSQSQLHQTQTDLEQSQSQLHQTQTDLEQSQSQLHQIQDVLEQFQDQMQQAETLLQEYQGQMYQTQAELEQSESQLHQTQSELQESKEELGEFQAIAEQLQEQLHQTQAELEQSESQLHQTQSELQESKEELGEFQAIAEQLQEQLHQ